MEIATAVEFARGTKSSVLVTLRRDGKPQLSNVMHHAAADGTIRISTTAATAKYHNIARTPWAALHVTSADFWSYVVLEGEASVTAPAAGEHDEVVEQLVELYRDLAGEHPDWDDYRRVMVADRRVVLRIAATRAYGRRA